MTKNITDYDDKEYDSKEYDSKEYDSKEYDWLWVQRIRPCNWVTYSISADRISFHDFCS